MRLMQAVFGDLTFLVRLEPHASVVYLSHCIPVREVLSVIWTTAPHCGPGSQALIAANKSPTSRILHRDALHCRIMAHRIASTLTPLRTTFCAAPTV